MYVHGPGLDTSVCKREAQRRAMYTIKGICGISGSGPASYNLMATMHPSWTSLCLMMQHEYMIGHDAPRTPWRTQRSHNALNPGSCILFGTPWSWDYFDQADLDDFLAHLLASVDSDKLSFLFADCCLCWMLIFITSRKSQIAFKDHRRYSVAEWLSNNSQIMTNPLLRMSYDKILQTSEHPIRNRCLAI